MADRNVRFQVNPDDIQVYKVTMTVTVTMVTVTTRMH